MFNNIKLGYGANSITTNKFHDFTILAYFDVEVKNVIPIWTNVTMKVS